MTTNDLERVTKLAEECGAGQPFELRSGELVFSFPASALLAFEQAVLAKVLQENAELKRIIAESQTQKPVAVVADVYESRYTLEWNGHSLPEGTKLFASPVMPNASKECK